MNASGDVLNAVHQFNIVRRRNIVRRSNERKLLDLLTLFGCDGLRDAVSETPSQSFGLRDAVSETPSQRPEV